MSRKPKYQNSTYYIPHKRPERNEKDGSGKMSTKKSQINLSMDAPLPYISENLITKSSPTLLSSKVSIHSIPSKISVAPPPSPILIQAFFY
jgi:hypothetical protein